LRIHDDIEASGFKQLSACARKERVILGKLLGSEQPCK